MKLSTRLTIAMVSLTLCTVVLLAFFLDRSLERAALPAALGRMESHVRLLSGQLEAYAGGARSDVLAIRGAPAVLELANALTLGRDITGPQSSAEVWRVRLEGLLVGQLRANPHYLQFRFIGAADDGKELVRVQRDSFGGPVGVVEEGEFQSKGPRDYFLEAMRLSDGEVYVSLLELNREFGEIQIPPVPVLRIATPVYLDGAEPFGVLIINVDMQPAFDALQVPSHKGGQVYLVNESGDYLAHSDPDKAFAFEFGRRANWQDDFPGLADPRREGAPVTAILPSGDAGVQAVSAGAVWLAGGREAILIERAPRAELLAHTVAVRTSALIAALLTAVAATAVAAWLARSLSRPVEKITAAVEGFNETEPIVVPEEAGGEIGRLAQAFSSMALDVQAKTKRLQQSNADLMQFAYVASHDLQEPLRTIGSFAELMARRYKGKLDQDADEYLDFIVEAATRMRQMIVDLLTYSRIDASDLRAASVDCNALIDEIQRDFGELIRECGAAIVTDELPQLRCDRSLMRHLFQNLIANALKFRNAEAPRIVIGARPGVGEWHSFVKDNGIGITQAYQKRVFDMFKRLHDRGRYPGGGVGLAMARKIVERHGGRIWIDPEVKQGTVVRFTISEIEDEKASVAAA